MHLPPRSTVPWNTWSQAPTLSAREVAMLQPKPLI
jgi:hypothetical protein